MNQLCNADYLVYLSSRDEANLSIQGLVHFSIPPSLQAYMRRYATVARLGHAPTDEDIARIHNGGPNGYKKRKTMAYWNRVQSYRSYL